MRHIKNAVADFLVIFLKHNKRYGTILFIKMKRFIFVILKELGNESNLSFL